MIRCENLSRKDLKHIGSSVAEAFLAEEGCFSDMPLEVAKKMFTIIIRNCYRTGNLYTTSKNQEGYMVYWTKEERPNKLARNRLMMKMFFTIPYKVTKIIGDGMNNWVDTKQRYKNEDNFVEVFMLVVRKEYQGQGFMRQMLEEPFALARTLNTVCVVDTDSPVKASKYCHIGMRVVEQKLQRNNTQMFALEYNRK